ncbi:hypothetical protein A3860_38835 [Niastella vici]|uniref:GAF domain-containing protein n=1 Tax=Niastella vici TaxID=1703345 RepID=A0A1V9FLA4_9BACT|nr:hypothetical protein A3860_38835 [Niastella vici]
MRFFYLAFTEGIIYSTYGNAIIRSKYTIAEINSIKGLHTNEKEEIMQDITTLCNMLQVVFAKKTRSNCTVLIKVPILSCPVSPDSELKILCIDYKHQLLRDTNEYLKLKHTVIGNTAFQFIVGNVLNNNAQFYYLNNNIPETRNYHTTYRPEYQNQKLPYKSELVYPVIPLATESSSTENEKITIWGFICIESDRKNSFLDEYDVSIIAAVADSLFEVIMKVNKLKAQKLA